MIFFYPYNFTLLVIHSQSLAYRLKSSIISVFEALFVSDLTYYYSAKMVDVHFQFYDDEAS